MVLGNDGKSASKNWIHSPDSLINGKVTYIVKFVGKTEVPEPRGMHMVKMALKKLNFSRQIKRTEGAKPPKVELGISIHCVTISDIKTKEVLHSISLHRVSFCADDKQDKRLFAFIAKLDGKHFCYGLDSLHQANDITLTIGQAFELAYEKFVKQNPSASGPKKLADMSKRVEELELENKQLRQRIAELETGTSFKGKVAKSQGSAQNEALQTSPHGASNLELLHKSNTQSSTGRKQEVIDAFNMQPFVPPVPAARLQPPMTKKPTQKAQDNLWTDVNTFDPYSYLNPPSALHQEMQDSFCSGLTISEADISLDSFDPLKH